MKSDSFKFGMTLAGMHPDQVRMAEAFNKVAGTSPLLNTRVARLASGMFKEAGLDGSACQLLFEKIATREWNPGYEPFVEAVLEVLGRDELEKRAAPNPLNFIKGVGTVAMGGLKNMFLTALALGAGGGAMYNWGKRIVHKDTEKADALETRIQHYQKLTKEIEDNLRRKGINPEEAAEQALKSYE